MKALSRKTRLKRYGLLSLIPLSFVLLMVIFANTVTRSYLNPYNFEITHETDYRFARFVIHTRQVPLEDRRESMEYFITSFANRYGWTRKETPPEIADPLIYWSDGASRPIFRPFIRRAQSIYSHPAIKPILWDTDDYYVERPEVIQAYADDLILLLRDPSGQRKAKILSYGFVHSDNRNINTLEKYEAMKAKMFEKTEKPSHY